MADDGAPLKSELSREASRDLRENVLGLLFNVQDNSTDGKGGKGPSLAPMQREVCRTVFLELQQQAARPNPLKRFALLATALNQKGWCQGALCGRKRESKSSPQARRLTREGNVSRRSVVCLLLVLFFPSQAALRQPLGLQAAAAAAGDAEVPPALCPLFLLLRPRFFPIPSYVLDARGAQTQGVLCSTLCGVAAGRGRQLRLRAQLAGADAQRLARRLQVHLRAAARARGRLRPAAGLDAAPAAPDDDNREALPRAGHATGGEARA